MSKRHSAPLPAKSPAKGHGRKHDAPTDRPAGQRVGARAFTRGAAAAKRRPNGRRDQSRDQRLRRFAALLPGFPTGNMLRGVPRAAWICALAAILNAVCWSLVTPPFEVTDEPSHYAYVKQLAETGSLPTSNSEQFSPEEAVALIGLHYRDVRDQPQHHTIGSESEQRELALNLGVESRNSGAGSPAAGVAKSQPPLYYALEAIPYGLAGGTALDRLQLMRFTSALFAGLTAMFGFLFVREVLPRERWAWTIGGLGIALMPLLGFMSGAVNPDSLLYAVSTASFFCLARAFKRGFGIREAASIGVLIAIGFLTKLNFIGLVPGIVLGLIVLSIRAVRSESNRSALRRLALAIGIGFSPVALYVGVNALSHHAPLGLASEAIQEALPRSFFAQINYIWQLYLPRLPGTVNDFPGLFTTRQIWFDGYVGLYGWLDTTFPAWVYNIAPIPAGVIAVLCANALFHSRCALRSRAPEIATYAAMTLGTLVLIGGASYHHFPIYEDEAEPRYLLPMLALLGAVLALAARGAGRRWGPAAGTLIVVLFLAHDIFSQLLVVGRYYG